MSDLDVEVVVRLFLGESPRAIEEDLDAREFEEESLGDGR